MKTKLMNLVKWFCRRLTYNDLASVIVVLHDVLSGSREDIRLKPEEKPPHYRDFRVDTTPPLETPPDPVPEEASEGWETLLRKYEKSHGRKLSPVKRRKGSAIPPSGCRCEHCNAPRKYLYMNNGKQASQVLCKVCGETSSTHRVRRESEAKYWCPHCGKAMTLWKTSKVCNIFKCFSYTCPGYLRKRKALTRKEKQSRKEQKYDPNYKLHYQYREYHISAEDLKPARPDSQSKVDLSRIHNDMQTVGLVLTFMINLGLSARVTRDALKGIFGIKISHQACINYVNAVAARISALVDRHTPSPGKRMAVDETYIIVENRWHYTWFGIDAETRAICGYNVSNSRGAQAALSLLHDCLGHPQQCTWKGDLITDGNPSYDNAVMAYNASLPQDRPHLDKRTVIGLENLDPESTEYRRFKQLVERLNRTYKYHTRPRAGFKTFEGAVALTTLFVAYYNFMRPHSARNAQPPISLQCLENVDLMPQAWIALIKEAA